MHFWSLNRVYKTETFYACFCAFAAFSMFCTECVFLSFVLSGCCYDEFFVWVLSASLEFHFISSMSYDLLRVSSWLNYKSKREKERESEWDESKMNIKEKKVKKHLTILKEPSAKRWISNWKTLPEHTHTLRKLTNQTYLRDDLDWWDRNGHLLWFNDLPLSPACGWLYVDCEPKCLAAYRPL